MRLKWSLLSFLVVTTFAGLLAIWLLAGLSRPDPIWIKSPLLGRTLTNSQEKHRLTDEEIRALVRRHLEDSEFDLNGRMELQEWKEVKVTLAPVQNVPLLGKSRLKRTLFECQIVFHQKDGAIRRQSFLIEKNSFVLVGNTRLFQLQ